MVLLVFVINATLLAFVDSFVQCLSFRQTDRQTGGQIEWLDGQG